MGLPLHAVSYRKPKAQDPSKFVPLEVLMRGVRIFWKSRKAADPLHLIASFIWLHFLVLSASIHSVTLLASRAFPAVAAGRQTCLAWTFQAGWPSRIGEGEVLLWPKRGGSSSSSSSAGLRGWASPVYNRRASSLAGKHYCQCLHFNIVIKSDDWSWEGWRSSLRCTCFKCFR